MSGSPKKRLGIEALIRWAFRDELPKAQAETAFLRPDTFSKPWGGITKTGLLGTEIQEPDIRNRYGLVPDFTAQVAPHPDAIALWHAVSRLSVMTLDLPDDWNPMADFGDLSPEGPAAIQRALSQISVKSADGARHLKESYDPAYLVRRAAIMSPPDWVFTKPERKFVKYSWGQPRWFVKQVVVTEQGSFETEVDGFDNVKRRPRDGAYRKSYLEPDPMAIVIARAEYQIWHTCLGMLVEDLAGRLDEHEPAETERHGWPWEQGAPHRPRILVDRTLRRPIVREPRPVAGPPPYRGLERKKDAAEMTERAYTVAEIDALRQAIFKRHDFWWANGAGTREFYDQNARIIAAGRATVEDELRTYMLAGLTAADLLANVAQPPQPSKPFMKG